MGTEIERKFLVNDNSLLSSVRGSRICQGYLNDDRDRTVRVRTIENRGYLTVKGITSGTTRKEYEYEIPVDDATGILKDLCLKPVIEKNRYEIEFKGMTWEVDDYFGANRGLLVAEIELEAEDQSFEKPEWVGAEVTADPRYFNSNLVLNPYLKW